MKCCRYPRQESDLRDFSVSPFQNSLYFRLAQKEISQNIARDDVLSRQNLISPRRYRSFSQQEPVSGYLHASRLPSTQFIDKSKQQDTFLGNFPNKFAEPLGKQTILSLDKPVSNYPFAHISPSRQLFGEPEQENFFRNPRNKSISSSEDVEYHTDEENPTTKFNVVYSADMKPSQENSRHIFPSEVVPRQSVPIFRQISILDENENEEKEEEKNAIEKSSNSISQQYNFLQDRYHSIGFDMPQVQHEPYISSQDLDMQKQVKNGEVFGKWNFMKDSLDSDLKQLKAPPNDLFETYSVAKNELITTEKDNEQINYHTSPQGSYIWRPTKDDTASPSKWDSATNLQNFIEINQLQETENTWPQVYPVMETDVRYFEDEKDEEREYFEDKIRKDNIQTKTLIYNPYTLPFNLNTWRATEDEKQLSGEQDFIIRKGLQEIQKTGQVKVYPVEQNNSNKYFQDQNKYTIQDETYIDTDKIIRAPIINVTPYIFPQSLLNILTASKYPTESSITDFPETKNNILRAKPIEKRHEKFLKSEKIVLDDEHNQNQIFVEDTYNARKYNSLALDRRSDTKNNTQNEALAKLDPDLIDEVENPPAEPTEPTPIESFEKRTTSTVKRSS